MVIDKNLNFKEHMQTIKKKTNSKLFLLKHLYNGDNTEKLQYFYSSMIVPSITHGYGPWCCASDTCISSLDSTHKRAIKIINSKTTSLSLHDFLKQKLQNQFKSAQQDQNHPLHHLIPRPRLEHRNKNLRYVGELLLPNSRCELFKRTLIYRGNKLFNNKS